MTESDRDLAQEELTADQDAILEDLFARCGRKVGVANERQHERRRWVVKMTVWIVRDAAGASTEREVRVLTQDISLGGFCFLLPQFLHKGTEIRARFDALSGRPILRGEVVSCVHTDRSLHRVGVRFTRFSPGG